jgi:D-alanyl-D-alanine carboxypeptidase (penicillin-binding protein 5/6)
MERPETNATAEAAAASHGLSRPVFILGIAILAGLLIALVFGIIRYVRPLPTIAPVTSFSTQISGAPAPGLFPWPATGQAAIAVDGIGVVASHGADTPQPMASTTKIMTALLILERHPLTGDDPGPTITLTQADADRYQQAIAQDESSVWVQAGEQITERQLLEGLLLPSANNFAEILAQWDAGSQQAFVAAMNARAAALGMHNTHFDDSSGFSAKTVSTAMDMLTLVQVAMRNPVFAAIVGEKTATLPLAGEVHNYNALLGQDGVVGVKTGSTDEAGGCLVIAADIADSAGQKHRVYTVVMGVQEEKDSLQNIFPATKTILDAIPQWLVSRRVISAGEGAGSYHAPWGGKVDAVAADDLTVTTWAGTPISDSVTLEPIKAPIGETNKVGEITVTAGGRTQRVDLVTGGGLGGPGLGWRLARD